MKKKKIASPFVVTVATLALASGCDNSVVGGGSGGQGGSAGEGGSSVGAGGTGTGTGPSTYTATFSATQSATHTSTETGTQTGMQTETDTVTATYTYTGSTTSTCLYYPAQDCSNPVEGAPCFDGTGAYCPVEVICGHYPRLDSRFSICVDGAWTVNPEPSFVPSCIPTTGTANPPGPCPCVEPTQGQACPGSLSGQTEGPCIYGECVEWNCDDDWQPTNTCG